MENGKNNQEFPRKALEMTMDGTGTRLHEDELIKQGWMWIVKVEFWDKAVKEKSWNERIYIWMVHKLEMSDDDDDDDDDITMQLIISEVTIYFILINEN